MIYSKAYNYLYMLELARLETSPAAVGWLETEQLSIYFWALHKLARLETSPAAVGLVGN